MNPKPQHQRPHDPQGHADRLLTITAAHVSEAIQYRLLDRKS